MENTSSNGRVQHAKGGKSRQLQAEGQAGRPHDLGISPPQITPEPPDPIRVAAGGKLTVPWEDLSTDLDEGIEIDPSGLETIQIRRPGRREWIALLPTSELPTRLLLHRPQAEGYEVEYYYVEQALRAPIAGELRQVRVFVYYSLCAKAMGLWVVHVTAGNRWYESLTPLFKQPSEFYAQHVVRIVPMQSESRYRVLSKPLKLDVTWPDKATDELLGEALGPERFIRSREHPIYRDLIEGEELS